MTPAQSAIRNPPSDMLPLDLPPPAQASWRENTGARWKERHPEPFAFFLHLVREEGILNVSVLAQRVGEEFGLDAGQSDGLRKHLGKLLRTEFDQAELESLFNREAVLVKAQGMQKTGELITKATSSKDVGAVAMATKMTFDMVQIANDKPTEIVEERKRFSLEDFEAIRHQAQRGKVLEAETVPVPALNEPVMVTEDTRLQDRRHKT